MFPWLFFEEWLQRRDSVTYDRYRAQRVAVKLAVQAAKRMADRRLGERLGNDFEGNKKMFWKEVKRVRKGEQARNKSKYTNKSKYFLSPIWNHNLINQD